MRKPLPFMEALLHARKPTCIISFNRQETTEGFIPMPTLSMRAPKLREVKESAHITNERMETRTQVSLTSKLMPFLKKKKKVLFIYLRESEHEQWGEGGRKKQTPR